MPDLVRETMGSGLEGKIAGRIIKAGSRQLVCGPGSLDAWAVRALRRASWRSALSVFVSVEGRVIGAILLGDELRRETPRAVQSLRTAGIRRIVMVTGDRAEAAETIALHSIWMPYWPTGSRQTRWRRSRSSSVCIRP